MKFLDAAAITQDLTAVKQFFQERNLLRKHAPHCTEVGCDHTMTEVKRGRNNDTIWCCPLHKGQGQVIHLHKQLLLQLKPQPWQLIHADVPLVV